MPMDTLDEANAWRAANSKEGVGHKSGGSAVPPADVMSAAEQHLAAHAVPPPIEAFAADEDPLSTVQRAREAERSIYEILADRTQRAQAGDARASAELAGLIRTHGTAYTNRLDAEKRWDKHRLEIGEVAPIAELEAIMDAALEPLASQLRNFPRNVAPAANPAAPSVAEKAIADALRPILDQISAALKANAA